MFDPTVTDTYFTEEYGFDGEPFSTTDIDDATCEAMKNDPTLNVISCCFTTTIVSNRRLSEVHAKLMGRELQDESDPQPSPEPSSAPSRGSEGIIEEYEQNGFVVVTTPPPVDQQVTVIENALKTVLGDVSIAIGGSGNVTVTPLIPSAAPSEMPSASGMTGMN